MDSDANKYLAALTAPFSKDALGAQVPDQYSFPTTTQFVKCNYTISADVNGKCDFTLLPSVYANLLFGVGASGTQPGNCGGVTVSDFNVQGNTIAPNWHIAGVAQPSFVQNYYEQFRLVGWGARVMPLLAPLNQSGRLMFSSTPSGATSYPALALGQVGAYDTSTVVGAEPPLVTYDELLRWNQLPGTDMAANVLTTELINVPSSVEFSYSKLSLEGGMEWVSKPTNAKVLEWRTSTNDAAAGNSLLFGGLNVGNSATCTLQNTLTLGVAADVRTVGYTLIPPAGLVSSGLPQVGDYVVSGDVFGPITTDDRNYITAVTSIAGTPVLVPRVHTDPSYLTIRVPKVRTSSTLGTPNFNDPVSIPVPLIKHSPDFGLPVSSTAFDVVVPTVKKSTILGNPDMFDSPDFLTRVSTDFTAQILTDINIASDHVVNVAPVTVRPIVPGVYLQNSPLQTFAFNVISAVVGVANSYLCTLTTPSDYPSNALWANSLDNFPLAGSLLESTGLFPTGTVIIYARDYAGYVTTIPAGLYTSTFLVELDQAPVSTLTYPFVQQWYLNYPSYGGSLATGNVDVTSSPLSGDYKCLTYDSGVVPSAITLHTYNTSEVIDRYLPSSASFGSVSGVYGFDATVNPPVQYLSSDGSATTETYSVPSCVTGFDPTTRPPVMFNSPNGAESYMSFYVPPSVESFDHTVNPPVQFDSTLGVPIYDEFVIPNYVTPLVYDTVTPFNSGEITFANPVTTAAGAQITFFRTALVPTGVSYLPEYVNTAGWSNMSCRGVGLPPAIATTVGDTTTYSNVPVLSVEVSFHLEGVAPVNRSSDGAFGFNASKPYSNRQFMDAAMDVAAQQPMFRKFQESSANALAMLSLMS